MNSCSKFKTKEILIEIACLLVPTLLAGAFFFYKLDMLRDFNHNPGNIWFFNFLIRKANATNIPVTTLIADVYKQWNQIPGIFYSPLAEFWTFALPLTQVWFAIVSYVFGDTARALILSGSIIGFATVFCTYMAGRLFFDRMTALFSSIFLATSLMHITPLRMGHTQYGVVALSGIIFLSLFYFAHKLRERKYLFIASVAFSLGLFNGYSMFIIFMPIFIIIFITFNKLLWKDFTFEYSNYLIFFLVSAIFYVIFTAGSSFFSNEKLGTTIHWINHWFSLRSESIFGPLTKLKNLVINIKKSFIILFYNAFENPDNVAPVGMPCISPVVTFFTIFGAAGLYRAKTMASRFLLTTAAVSFFIFVIVLNADFRYLMVIISVVYLIAGFGVRQFIDKVMRKNNSLLAKSVIWVMISFAIIYSAYSNFNYYFGIYADHDGYLGPNFGRVQAGNFVNANYNPDETLVILGDKITIQEDVFAFSTLPKSFEYKFWPDIKDNLKKFEEDTFKRKEKIVFVFSNGKSFLEMPGFRYSDPVDWETFEDLHPNIAPVKIIKATGGWPVISIFELKKKDIMDKIIKLDGKNNSYTDTAKKPEIAAVKLGGYLKNPMILVNNNPIRLDSDILPSMEVVFLPYGKSRLKFVPYFTPKTYLDDIYEIHNINLNKEDPRFLELSSFGEGHVIYRIQSPTKILSMDIETRPRILNDKAKENSMTALYSLDGMNYQQLYNVASNGSKKWDYHFHRDTYHRITVDSQTIFIKFVFKGEKSGTQLWSPFPVGDLGRLYAMKFNAEIKPLKFDGLELKNGKNKVQLFQETANKTGYVKVYFKNY